MLNPLNFTIPMRHTFTLKPVILFFAISLFFFQCTKEKSSNKTDADFTHYISGFTSGVISKRSSVKIRLTEAYNNAKISEKIDKKSI